MARGWLPGAAAAAAEVPDRLVRVHCSPHPSGPGSGLIWIDKALQYREICSILESELGLVRLDYLESIRHCRGTSESSRISHAESPESILLIVRSNDVSITKEDIISDDATVWIVICSSSA